MPAPDEKKPPNSYAAAGVSIERGNEAVRRIRPLAAMAARPEVMGTIGNFAGGFRLNEAELLAGADGVGSKLLLAQEMNRFDSIGIDLVAMNVNDVLAAGGEPLFFLDYIAMGRVIPEKIEELVAGMARGCQESGAALLGGETAEMPELYPQDTFDLSGFAVGRRVFSPARAAREGDVVLGLASSGFHANGYGLVRAIAKHSRLSWDACLPELEHRPLGEVLLAPTTIYVRAVMDLWSQLNVGAMAHITGGGLVENVPRTLEGLGAVIHLDSWPRPAEMALFQRWGAIEESEMLRTFNCGIGFTLTVKPGDDVRACAILAQHGIPAWAIGTITGDAGVRFV